MRTARTTAFAGSVALASLAIRCTSFGSGEAPQDGGAANDASIDSPGARDGSVDAPEGAVEWSVNGHKYLFVAAPGTSYEDAKAAAEVMHGHLVTLANADENAFVFDMLRRNLDASYHAGFTPNFFGPWLGAERTPSSGSADAGYAWSWVTQEPFTYADWFPGEPNGANTGENRVVYFYQRPDGSAPVAGWADVIPTLTCSGYVVEFE
jgi:hypothetical protein